MAVPVIAELASDLFGQTVRIGAPEAVDGFEQELTARYEAQYKLHPAIYRCAPSAGARRVA